MTLVTVTPQHIVKGIPGSISCCPLALAIAEVLNLRSVQVKLYDGKPVAYTTKDYVYALPAECAHFINLFDRRINVSIEPFEIGEPMLMSDYQDTKIPG